MNTVNETPKEKVLRRLSRKAKSLLHFLEPNPDSYYFHQDEYKRQKLEYDNFVNDLKKKNKSVEERILILLTMNGKYPTMQNKRYQSRSGSLRSAHDLWRLYNYYIEEIDIFTIMRAIYRLSFKKQQLGCHFCTVVRKIVFWKSNFYNVADANLKADLGVALRDWENIGLEA